MADKEKAKRNRESKKSELRGKIKENDVNALRDSCHGKRSSEKLKSEIKSPHKDDSNKRENVCSFATKIKPRKSKEMEARKLAQLTEAFHLFDFDRDGFISFNDLKKVYASLDKGDTDDEQIRQMIAEGLTPLDLDAFIKLMGLKTLDLDDEDVLIEALSQWDCGNGLISEEKFRHDLMTWGDKFTEEEADAALEHAPIIVAKDNRKMIDYVQFTNDLCGFRRGKNFLKGT